MDWTDKMAMRIGYLMIRKSPENAERLWHEVELEKDIVMEHNRNNKNRWIETTMKYQQNVKNEHRKLYNDMTIDIGNFYQKISDSEFVSKFQKRG